MKINREKFGKEAIIKAISRIREEIGHEDIEPDILDVVFNEDSGEMIILTSDRPEKSLVIGKGGWVVGRLKEELNVNRIHVEAYSDIIIREYRMKLAYAKIEKVMNFHKDAKSKLPLLNLSKLLKKRIEYPYDLGALLENYLENYPENLENTSKTLLEKPLAVVALSGGVDSSFSLIIAKMIGFKPLAVTVNPGDIILPKHFRESVESLTERLGVDHKYLDVDISQVVDGALEGRFHPCGRCSKLIEEAIMDYVQKSGIEFMIFGDLLATGAQSMVLRGDILRINLPALLSATKSETKALAGRYGISSSGAYGCPLLAEVQKRHVYMRRFSIQRVLRETRAGVLEPGEALDMIMSLCGNKSS